LTVNFHLSRILEYSRIGRSDAVIGKHFNPHEQCRLSVLAGQTFGNPVPIIKPAVSRREFLESLDNFPKKTGILFITQYPRETLKFPRLIVMLKGRIYYDGAPDDFFSDPSLYQPSGIDPPVKYVLDRHFPKS